MILKLKLHIRYIGVSRSISDYPSDVNLPRLSDFLYSVHSHQEYSTSAVKLVRLLELLGNKILFRRNHFSVVQLYSHHRYSNQLYLSSFQLVPNPRQYLLQARHYRNYPDLVQFFLMYSLILDPLN